MQQNVQSKRLLALDGLRGYAMILVFLSHIGTQHLSSILLLPTFLYSIVFSSGSMGVAFLFVLSGFLMASLYPHPSSGVDFLQKRYTRIFPLFLTVSICQLVFRVLPGNIVLQTVVFLLLPVAVHTLWVYRIKSMTSTGKRTLFLSFLFLQFFVGILYFWISQTSRVSEFSKLSSMNHLFLTGLINSTLTFFAGNSFPLLDGVYWSLAAEILFYILYPVVCVPVIAYLSVKKRLIKVFFLLALAPLFFGLAGLGERVSSFAGVQPIFFYHFVGGMTLGYLYNKHGSSISLLNKLFLKNFSIGSTVLFIGLFVFAHIPMQFLNSFFRQILLTVPYTIIVGILLVPETILTRIFSSKLLVYIGTISYSIYLSHIWITHVTLQVLGHPATAVQAIVYIVIAFSLCLLFASTLYFLLERPYFMRAKAKKKRMTDFSYVPGNKALFICFSICAIYLVTTFFAYKINLTYNLLHDPHWRSVAVSTRISKADSAFMANEKLQVAEERKKTLIMLLPFFTLVCYFLYSGINKTKFVPRRA